MDEKKETNFLVKVGTIRSRSYASSLFLKADDIIVALNNELYIFGEKKLVSELKELKKEGEKAILTVLRGDTFFDLIIENSLGCKFVTTTAEETQKIRHQFSSKEKTKFTRTSNSSNRYSRQNCKCQRRGKKKNIEIFKMSLIF